MLVLLLSLVTVNATKLCTGKVLTYADCDCLLLFDKQIDDNECDGSAQSGINIASSDCDEFADFSFSVRVSVRSYSKHQSEQESEIKSSRYRLFISLIPHGRLETVRALPTA